MTEENSRIIEAITTATRRGRIAWLKDKRQWLGRLGDLVVLVSQFNRENAFVELNDRVSRKFISLNTCVFGKGDPATSLLRDALLSAIAAKTPTDDAEFCERILTALSAPAQAKV